MSYDLNVNDLPENKPTERAGMRIAYLVNRYPAVSHSFIRREIQALERAGISVLRLALRGWDEAQRGDDRTELARTRFVLRQGFAPLFRRLAVLLATQPLRLLKALRLTWRIGRRAERSLLFHFVYLLEACQVLQWLKEDGTNHLHVHFGTNPTTVALLVRELGGPPFTFTVHGPEEFDKAPLIALAEKIRRSEAVVAVSSFGRSQLMRHVLPQDWPKIHVIHCGLDHAFYDGPGLPLPQARRLVCVGRLCEQKGQLLLIDAARQLRDKGWRFELVLAGDGELRCELEGLIEYHGLGGFVRITGWLSTEQVREEILSARALVLPSFAEGLPVVLMEAMALRRPVISTYVAGIPELVRPGEHGWLIPAGDVQALTDAMRDCLAADIEVLDQLGAAARERVLERHDVDSEARKLISLFNGGCG